MNQLLADHPQKNGNDSIDRSEVVTPDDASKIGVIIPYTINITGPKGTLIKKNIDRVIRAYSRFSQALDEESKAQKALKGAEKMNPKTIEKLNQAYERAVVVSQAPIQTLERILKETGLSYEFSKEVTPNDASKIGVIIPHTIIINGPKLMDKNIERVVLAYSLFSRALGEKSKALKALKDAEGMDQKILEKHKQECRRAFTILKTPDFKLREILRRTGLSYKIKKNNDT